VPDKTPTLDNLLSAIHEVQKVMRCRPKSLTLDAVSAESIFRELERLPENHYPLRTHRLFDRLKMVVGRITGVPEIYVFEGGEGVIWIDVPYSPSGEPFDGIRFTLRHPHRSTFKPLVIRYREGIVYGTQNTRVNDNDHTT